MAVEVILMGNWFSQGQLGLYFYAIGLASLFEVGVHWGGQYMVNREAAARFDELNARLPALFASTVGTVVAVAAVVTSVHGVALAVFAGGALLRAASTLLGAICIGRGRIVPPALARVFSAAIGVGGLLLIVRPDPTLPRLAIVIALATLGYMLPLVVASHRLGVRLLRSPATLPALWRDLAGQLWPFLLLFFCGQLFYRVDASLLKWLADADLVGRYGLAFKWIEGLFFLPYVVASAAIPALVRASREQGTDAAHRMILRVAGALSLGTLAVTVGLLVVGEPLLLWLVGANFEASVPLYRVFAWLLPIHSLGVFFAAALVTQHRERRVLLICAIAATIGLSIKIPGFVISGIDGFSIGVFAGVIVHTLGCGWSLWRRPLPG